MPNRIIRALEELSGRLGLRVLTAEYEILLALLDRDHVPANELKQLCSISRAGFFNALARLKHWGFIQAEFSEKDRRVKLYRLHPRTKHTLHEHFRALRLSNLTLDTLSLRRLDGAWSDLSVPADTGRVSQQRLPHLTPEYQILLCVFLKPGRPSAEISASVSASGTKANSALRHLRNAGLITFKRCPSDSRRTLNFPSGAANEAIELSMRRVFEYLDDLDGEVNRG